MPYLDPIDDGSLPGAPLRITVHPQRAEPRFVPVDHDPFADDGAAERALTRLGIGGDTRSGVARLIAGDDIGGVANAMKSGATPRRPDELRTYHPSLSENVKTVSAGDRAVLDAAETTRGYVDAQNASAWHAVWRGGPAEQANSLFIPLSRKATKEELAALKAVGEAHGLSRAIDTGTGITLTNFSAQPSQLNGGLVKDVRGIIPDSSPKRVMVDSNYIDFVRAREKGVSSGALTKLWLSYVNKTPEIRAAINNNPEIARKALGNLERDEEWASKVGATSVDIQNARRIIGEGPGFVDRIEAALKTGSFLPALAFGLFGAGSLSEPSAPGSG